jgi:hypothetical protein
MLKIILILIMSLPPNSKAEQQFKRTQIHIMAGHISGSFSGATSGDFAVSQALNAEIEFINTPKTSFMFRNIIAFDPETSKNVYSVTSLGQRFYWLGSALPVDVTDINGSKYTIIPKRRFYYGYDVGISQAVIASLGPVLDAVSTMIDLGAYTGMNYQMGQNWGIEAQVGYSKTFGISSVSVNGSTLRFLLGTSFFY